MELDRTPRKEEKQITNNQQLTPKGLNIIIRPTLSIELMESMK